MIRIFLDANILFSASFPQSHLAKFLGKLEHHAKLLTNAYARAEAEKNISAKHPSHLAILETFAASLELIPIQPCDLQVQLSQKDHPILCGAIAGGADFLLTGDKRDFGHLFSKTVHGVTIVTVQLLLAELLERGIIRES